MEGRRGEEGRGWEVRGVEERGGERRGDGRGRGGETRSGGGGGGIERETIKTTTNKQTNKWSAHPEHDGHSDPRNDPQ